MERIALTQPRTLQFGDGSFAGLLVHLAARRPRRILVVTSPSVRPILEERLLDCADARFAVEIDASTRGEPTAAHFLEVLARARDFAPDLVLAAGGGSALDVGKLVAALLPGAQQLDGVFGSGRLGPRGVDLVCLPTTAGTGSEVSPNAILLDEAEAAKKAVISPHLVPDATFVDPLLMRSLPAPVTAATGMDALTHCIEVYANRFAHPLTDGYALEGTRLIGGHLERAVRDGADAEARSALALGSLYGGFGLGPVNTAAVHALAYPLGSRYGVAHGVANAVLLPHVLAFNLPAAPERYARVGIALGAAAAGSALETAERGLQRLRALSAACGIPTSLAALGVPLDAVPELVGSALSVQRLLRNNPREVTPLDAQAIYLAAFEPLAVPPEAAPAP